MNNIPSNRKSANKTAKSATEQIIITVTKKQYRVISKLCGRFRLTPEEMARDSFFGNLHQDDEMYLLALERTTDEEATGKHPAWEYIEANLKEVFA